MPEVNNGLDLASQTGQNTIANAITGLGAVLAGDTVAKRLCVMLVSKSVITEAEYAIITGEAYPSGS